MVTIQTPYRSGAFTDAKFQLLAEAVNGIRDYAIFLLDPQGYIVTWNAGAERIKGWKDYEIIGKHFSTFYTQKDLDRNHPQEELRIASKEGRFEEESWRVKKDGTRFWANVLITRIMDSRGNILGFSKVTRDLTERKLSEEQLKKGHETLEQRVVERTLELALMTKDLKRAISSRDEFLSVASHELKTPLTSLHLQAQILQKRFEDLSSEIDPLKLKKSLDTIVRQSEKLASLVDYMLDVSRARLGKFTFQFEKANLSESVKNLLEQWHEPLRTSGCTLKSRIEGGVEATFDVHRIEQVIANLLANAVKYAPGSKVEVKVWREGAQAFLRVKDDGAGIPTEKQKTIFEPFERAVKSGSSSGLGLGLYISKSIVEAHQGTIELESTPEKGATFTIRFPLERPITQ